MPTSWSPDGTTIAYTVRHDQTGFDIWTYDFSRHQASAFLETAVVEAGPKFSPDGKWLAYHSMESGSFQVYAQAYPGPGAKIRISSGKGLFPVWSRDGKEIFYRGGWDKRRKGLVAVPIQGNDPLELGAPRLLFKEASGMHPSYTSRNNLINTYDVALDGERFLMIRLEEGPAGARQTATELRLAFNWIDTLKRNTPRP